MDWHAGHTGMYKSYDYFCICLQALSQFSAGSSVASGAALGSKKSWCWSSFRYLGGVRMCVEPMEDKTQKVRHESVNQINPKK